MLRLFCYANYRWRYTSEWCFYSITESILEEFQHHLKGLNLCLNTVVGIIRKLKYALWRASREGYEVNLQAFDNIYVKEEEVQTVYLSLEELNRLASLVLKKEIAQIRDLFLVGCFTALRFSDYSRLSEENFSKGNIYKLTQKTDVRVVIPIHLIINQIIERNKGYDFLNYKKTQQNFNDVIKRLCKKAGITESIMIEKTVGFRKMRKTYKKYQLVSSHTARRTGATNMYLSGIPIFRIMLITGHKTEQAFFKYIRIRKEENAEVLANHPFFTIVK